MNRIRLDVSLSPDGSIVQLRDSDTGTLVTLPGGVAPFRRVLRTIGPKERQFPVPPQDEVDKLPAAGDRAADLCRAADTDPHQALLERFFERLPKADDLKVFGRYLFATLIGPELWSWLEQLEQPAGAAEAQWRDLALAFPPNASWLTRLPWELMHGPTGFLAAMPRMSIVREIQPAKPRNRGTLAEIVRIPRVLFVVGTNFRDDVVRPGAEYLQLVRRLRAKHLSLQTRLLAGATPECVQKAVERTKPDVVHFICHGDMSPERGAYLDVVPEGKEEQAGLGKLSESHHAGADQILEWLRGESGLPLPRVVVLSACYTAGEFRIAAGEVTSALGTQLVEGGVPMVVGMTGPAADQACRLFARQFYVSLAQGVDIARATALGRRAALMNVQGNLRTSPDWAYPAIFLRQDLEDARLHVAPAAEDERLQQWEHLRSEIGSRPFFCDRFDVFARFDLLMSDPTTQRDLTNDARPVNVLSIEVPVADPEPHDPDRFGRTWLLKELAEKACVDGHLPIPLSVASKIKTRRAFVDQLIDATDVVVGALGIPDENFPRLKALMDSPPGGAPPPEVPEQELRDRWRTGRDDDAMYARALRLDLKGVLQRVRAACCDPDQREHCRLVLLIDDLHRMDEAAIFVLNHVIGGLGLFNTRETADVMRVVFGWSSKAADGKGQESIIEGIKEWLVSRPARTKIAIERFGSPLEARLAYQHSILHLPPAADARWVSFEPADDPNVQLVWSLLDERIDGVPSRLAQARKLIGAMMGNAMMQHVLLPADDERALELVQGELSQP